MIKTCKECKQPKTIDQFSRHCKTPDGYQNFCKLCMGRKKYIGKVNNYRRLGLGHGNSRQARLATRLYHTNLPTSEKLKFLPKPDLHRLIKPSRVSTDIEGNITHKTCCECKKHKHVDEFNLNIKDNTGLQARCTKCRRAYYRRHYGKTTTNVTTATSAPVNTRLNSKTFSITDKNSLMEKVCNTILSDISLTVEQRLSLVQKIKKEIS